MLRDPTLVIAVAFLSACGARPEPAGGSSVTAGGPTGANASSSSTARPAADAPVDPDATITAASRGSSPTRGVRLGDLTWVEAEARLTADTVVVIPLGAASKEHGPHLRLRNDELLAEYFAGRVLAAADVVVAPTVGYHFYPAFTEYPGSISLRFETARDLIVDLCRSLAAYGPRRFYVLNTGISTLRPLKAAAEVLAADGVELRYTDLLVALGPVEAELREQEGGTHADELETSMLLYIDPSAVDMSKAVKDYHPKGEGGLSRDPASAKTYSPTGIWGDPTLATRAKGERLCEAMSAAVLADLEALRQATPPAPTPPAPTPAPTPPAPTPPSTPP